ncbi:hypothetical protein BDN72DRAFT_844595 [Pluteus cervinus]|uniref:Uncharacterized protein n=1 Tax=Pluteus cervinus TaxID=181527 RepID=A0ACD3AK50_9AGAR|nr:hypothetical protein BDN72DRAFT_844595 [Pluteus cervinus]
MQFKHIIVVFTSLLPLLVVASPIPAPNPEAVAAIRAEPVDVAAREPEPVCRYGCY